MSTTSPTRIPYKHEGHKLPTRSLDTQDDDAHWVAAMPEHPQPMLDKPARARKWVSEASTTDGQRQATIRHCRLRRQTATRGRTRAPEPTTSGNERGRAAGYLEKFAAVGTGYLEQIALGAARASCRPSKAVGQEELLRVIPVSRRPDSHALVVTHTEDEALAHALGVRKKMSNIFLRTRGARRQLFSDFSVTKK